MTTNIKTFRNTIARRATKLFAFALIALISSFACSFSLASCTSESEDKPTSATKMSDSDSASTNATGANEGSEGVDDDDSEIVIDLTNMKIPDSSTGSTPSTPEEVQMASDAAHELNVPFDGTVVCTIGEPFYSDELGMTVRSISFYQDGKLVAGVDCDEEGNPVGNYVYY